METASSDGVSCRSQTDVIQWAGLVAIVVVFCAVTGGVVAAAIGLPLLGYALQGLVSEYLGVSIDPQSISFPNRLFSDIPLATLWRRNLFLRSCSRIDRRSKRSVTVYTGGEKVTIKFPSAQDKDRFLEYAKKQLPTAQISLR